jgi:hypothetical protein
MFPFREGRGTEEGIVALDLPDTARLAASSFIERKF